MYWSWMNNSLSVKSVDHYFHMGYFLRYIPCQCSIFKLYYYYVSVWLLYSQDESIFEYISHVKVKLNSTRFKKMTLVNVVYRTSNVKIIRVCQCDKSAKDSSHHSKKIVLSNFIIWNILLIGQIAWIFHTFGTVVYGLTHPRK